MSDWVFVRRVLIVFGLAAFAAALWMLSDILLMVFGAALVALALRALTEPIVQRTLEPLVYRDFAKGIKASPESLRAPGELLALKICDMATGSGAFLVEAFDQMFAEYDAAQKTLEALGEGKLFLDVRKTCLVTARDEKTSLSARRHDLCVREFESGRRVDDDRAIFFRHRLEDVDE